MSPIPTPDLEQVIDALAHEAQRALARANKADHYGNDRSASEAVQYMQGLRVGLGWALALRDGQPITDEITAFSRGRDYQDSLGTPDPALAVQAALDKALAEANK